MKFNLKQLLRERVIDKTFAWLVKNGVSEHVAIHMQKDKLDRIQFKHMELLCRILWCTPNDLFVITPEELKKKPLPPGHPLLALQPRPDAPDILKKLRQLPLDKLKELERLMEEGEKK
jgi:DNA-binding Xre family transcriptional regulator